MLFCISVESQQRELDAQLLLAGRLVSSGHVVLVAQDQFVRRHIETIAGIASGDIILVDKSASVSCIPKRIGPLKQRFPKARVAVLLQEGWVGDSCLQPSHRMYTSSVANRFVDEFYVFGSTQLNMFREATPTCANIAYDTGNPRIDLLTTHSDFYQQTVKLLQECYGEINLVTSPFVTRTLSSNNADQFYPLSWENDLSWGKALKAEFEMRHSAAMSSYDQFIKLTKEIAVANPDKTFVFRPHPTSRISDAVDRLEENRNVFFSRQYPVEPWILAGSCLFTHGCTTGLQAQIAGVPHVAYSIRESAYLDSVALRSADAYLVSTEQGLRLERNTEVNRPKLQDIYSNIGRATECVANRLLSLAASTGNFERLGRVGTIKALEELIVHKPQGVQYWKWEHNFAKNVDFKAAYLSRFFRSDVSINYLKSGAFLIS